MSKRIALQWLSSLLMIAGCSAIVDVDTDKLGGSAGAQNNGASGASDGGADGAVDTCDDGCQDGIACTADQCVGNVCKYLPNDGICLAGQRCDAKLGCIDNTCKSASECNDGIACTVDACDAKLGCTHKAQASVCDDGIDCTDDSCTGGTGADKDGCVHKPNNSRCSFCFGASATCSVAQKGCVGTPRDCSDGNACTTDSCSAATSSCMSVDRDADSDGVAANSVSGTFCGGGDCDDANAAVYPGATEVCDKVDNDCDGMADEGCTKLPDTCDTASTVTLDANGRATVSGTLSDFASNYTTSCGTAQGLDAVYKIPVTKTSDIIIDSGTSAARVVLAAATSCDASAFTSTCAGAISSSTRRSRLIVHNFDPAVRGNTLYLLVDGAASSESGAFSVGISVKPVAADTCTAPLNLAECGTVLGVFGAAAGQERGTCQGGAGEAQTEAVFQISAPTDGSVVLTSTSTQFFPVVYVRDVCDSADNGDELACRNSASGMGINQRRAEVTANALAGTPMFIFVDGGQPGAAYTLRCVP